MKGVLPGTSDPMQHAKTIETIDELAKLLSEVSTIAVVGLSDNPSRDSHGVSAYLQRNGFRVLGVNPSCEEALGERCYPSLAEIPPETRKEVDLVAVFRRPEAVPPIIEEAARLGLDRVWLQIGVSSPEALERAAGLGVTVIAEKCLRVVHGLARDRIRQSRKEG